ncbi:MAG: thiamine-phosphate kinase [Roseibium sp.]|uniref:thiamine-phosphate kinase n=1 Tax=Roseibium sp. TaxID=1936156 RepID=UPI001B10C7A3|nr:thiamine-phosphate kinase [Roseibium sp.]MBO6891021.1 thiamine-phosphate kinase [Roseibium sp.]MBO6932233.1 thiamine-phosphate kinase [Roseibium sp.]
MSDPRPGEFDLIKRYFAPLAKDPGSLGLTDDAAVLTPEPGFDLVLTKDMLAAGVHFFADDPPEAIAAKALRVNLSDLAAKGARGRGYLLGLALPANWTESWLQAFCAGLAADQNAYEIVLLGGDTIRSADGLQISVTAIGEVEAGKAVRRSGAKPGDVLFVSGTIGDAAAGLKARLEPEFCSRAGISESGKDHILGRYLMPRPRTGLAGCLTRYARAAMDISDGLFADCGHMASASNCTLVVDLDQVPLSSALRGSLAAGRDEEMFECLNGGDDYEILASVSAEKADDFERDAAANGCAVTRIGRVEAGEGDLRVQRSGVDLDIRNLHGFKHF